MAGNLSFECERSRWETGGGVIGGVRGARAAFSITCARDDAFSAAGAAVGAKLGVSDGGRAVLMKLVGDLNGQPLPGHPPVSG